MRRVGSVVSVLALFGLAISLYALPAVGIHLWPDWFVALMQPR